MDIQEARALLEAPGAMFELTTEPHNGRPLTVFKTRERSMREKVQKAAALHGDTRFLAYGDTNITYKDFGELVWGSAHALVEQYGLQRGDRIGILAYNRPEWLIALFGATSAGGVGVGLNGAWHADEIAYALRDSGCRYLIVEDQLFDRIAPVIDAIEHLETVFFIGDDAPEGTIPIDTAVIEAIPGVTFAAKRELFDEPVLGKTLRALEIIPIDRDNPELAKQALKDAAVNLGKRMSVVIFPEGTRAPRGEMLAFKGGAFVFAIQLQVPIVPVAIHNAAEVMPARKYLTICGGRIVVELLPPISTVGLTIEDYPKLREQVRAVLVNALRPEDGGRADRSDLGFAPLTASERARSSVNVQRSLRI